jgi:hypothetical protein
MGSAPALAGFFTRISGDPGKHPRVFGRTILVVGKKPGLRDAVLQTMQCFINRSFNKAFLL